MRGRIVLLLAIALPLLAALACNDNGGGRSTPTEEPSLTLTIVNQNSLHGLIDEDPRAEPFDRYPERIQLLGKALADAQPDTITVQEVRFPGNPADGYPDARDTLLAALNPQYQDYRAVFGNFLGEAIDGDGLGQLTISRLVLDHADNHTVSEIRSAVHTQYRSDFGLIDVYNVHLEGTGAVVDVTQDESVIEIEKLISVIDQTRSVSGPVIVAGDFNAQPHDPSIQRFVQEGYIDALETGGDATCDGRGDPGCSSDTIPLGDNPDNLTDHRIDYIFVLPGVDTDIEVTSASRFHDSPVDIGDGHTLWLADHIGVQAALKLTHREPTPDAQMSAPRWRVREQLALR